MVLGRHAKLVLGVLIVILLISSLGCIGDDKIGEISSNPDLYEGEGVKVKGSVVNIFKLPLVSGGAYELSDGTGTIWVTTISGVPPKGEELLVKGTVHTTLKFDGKTFGVVINETTRKYA